jgi:hypothetical protein
MDVSWFETRYGLCDTIETLFKKKKNFSKSVLTNFLGNI